ncbi:hypothetical protein RFI_05981 [Reticulomyxa filosa]|uniref:Uncharacterized protein n=1 Tax=Reticulomyxa filosa TaxID=46433 RepID=X6NXV2_RETFI|nr:hypothetical protein RFI_05981 [Reticulomyxa filosa]|eukprot:ETO31140.1 hypothetical protein RFI_05981 [Reticulomyxa filosa]
MKALLSSPGRYLENVRIHYGWMKQLSSKTVCQLKMVNSTERRLNSIQLLAQYIDTVGGNNLRALKLSGEDLISHVHRKDLRDFYLSLCDSDFPSLFRSIASACHNLETIELLQFTQFVSSYDRPVTNLNNILQLLLTHIFSNKLGIETIRVSSYSHEMDTMWLECVERNIKNYTYCKDFIQMTHLNGIKDITNELFKYLPATFKFIIDIPLYCTRKRDLIERVERLTEKYNASLPMCRSIVIKVEENTQKFQL